MTRVRFARGARLFVVAVALLRALVVLVSVQATGVLHVVADVASELSRGVLHEDDDCGADERGAECPPGCPSCHSAHGMMAVLPVPPAALLAEAPPGDEPAHPWSEAQAPPQGARSAVFHPPKASPSVASSRPDEIRVRRRPGRA